MSGRTGAGCRPNPNLHRQGSVLGPDCLHADPNSRVQVSGEQPGPPAAVTTSRQTQKRVMPLGRALRELRQSGIVEDKRPNRRGAPVGQRSVALLAWTNAIASTTTN